MSPDAHLEPLQGVVVELTNRCNLRCPHCASNSGAAREGELATEDWLRIIGEIAELGCDEVTLMGGELFLHRDWLQICQKVNATGMKLAIVTNGLLVTDRLFEKLSTLCIERLGVSLDGGTDEAYRAARGVDGRARVWKVFERVQASGLTEVNAITTVSRINLQELQLLYEQLKGTGIAWQVQMASSVSERFDDGQIISPEEFVAVCKQLSDWIIELGEDNFIALMDDFGYFPLDPSYTALHDEWQGCHAGTNVAGIRANGDVLGCLSLGDPFIEGNLRDRPLREIWTDPNSFAQLRNKQLSGHCARCPMAERCKAGCTAMAWSATGDVGSNPYCIRHQECRALLSQVTLPKADPPKADPTKADPTKADPTKAEESQPKDTGS